MDLAGRVDEDVDLATDPEVVEVDPGFNREARPAQDEPLVMRLEVIHVGTIAVRLLADAVARPVDEPGPVAGVIDDPARGGIDLPAVQGPARGEGRADPLDCRIAGAGDDR